MRQVLAKASKHICIPFLETAIGQIRNLIPDLSGIVLSLKYDKSYSSSKINKIGQQLSQCGSGRPKAKRQNYTLQNSVPKQALYLIRKPRYIGVCLNRPPGVFSSI